MPNYPGSFGTGVIGSPSNNVTLFTAGGEISSTSAYIQDFSKVRGEGSGWQMTIQLWNKVTDTMLQEIAVKKKDTGSNGAHVYLETTDGAEADNGSTSNLIKWFIPDADRTDYALVYEIHGHGDIQYATLGSVFRGAGTAEAYVSLTL